jgi:putative nucleotidyltransferase with HDIG domain
MIPSRDQCLKLLEEHGVPDNIMQHILQVTRVAMFLGKRISRKEKVNLPFLEAASLLHDLDKHMTFDEPHKHGHKSADIVRRLGFSELAPLLLRHRMTAINDPGLDTLEEKILYYADMRVNNDVIVPLPERIAYIKDKYGSRSTEAAKKILAAISPLESLEKEILGKSGVSERLEGME